MASEAKSNQRRNLVQSRASFLGSSAATAAVAWLGTTAVGPATSTVAPRDILQTVVRAILPFDHPKFPAIQASAIVARIDSLFGLLSSPPFVASLASLRGSNLGDWARSPSADRRRFYTSVRAVTFFAFYSLDASWPAIDYTGPILPAAGK